MNRRRLIVPVALLLSVAVFAPTFADGSTVALERIEWAHQDLDLYLWDVTEYHDRAEFQFAVQLRSGAKHAATNVGYPRYSTGGTRWHDAMIRGQFGRDRTVSVSVDRTGRAFFSVVVPRNATELAVSVGNQEVRMATSEWINDLARPGRRVSTVRVPDPAAQDAPGRPARLTASLRWEGDKPFGDGALDAGETGLLLIDVLNEGQRTAAGVRVRLEPAQRVDLRLAEVVAPDIKPGRVETVRVPIVGGAELTDGTVLLTIRVIEPFGHDAAPIEFEMNTRAFEPPELVLIEDFAVDGTDIPVPRDSIVTLHLRIRNIGNGIAAGAVAQVSPGANVFTAHDSPERFELGQLGPGEFQQITYRCYANQRAEQLDLKVELTDENKGSTASSSVLILPLQDSYSTVPRIVRVTPDPRGATTLAAAPPPLTSDVDRHVPMTTMQRGDAIAVVLGVEEYASVPSATYAAADARTAARYFEHALGIPAERIELLVNDDVTQANMNRIFGKDGWLARRIEEDTEVFVYFAGHGVAESEHFDPYLIPHDGDLSYVRQTGMSLDSLVERLSSLDAAHVTVFLDACFSGLTREGGALMANARKLVVVPVRRTASGISVFSAAGGSQTAHGLDEQGHGLFSYFVFRGLGGAADLDGDRAITSGELALYLEEEVEQAALRADFEQTPAIFPDDEGYVLVQLP